MRKLTVFFIMLICALTVGCAPKEKKLAQKLFEGKTEYIGDNSAVTGLVDMLPLPNGITRGVIELATDSEPYGLTVLYKMEDDKLKTNEEDFLYNSALLLACIDNAEAVTHAGVQNNALLSSYAFYYSHTLEYVNEKLGVNVKEYSQSPEKLEELIGLLSKE